MKKIALFVLITLFTAPAFAVASTKIGTYTDWVAYTFMEGGNKVCYVASQPLKEQGDYDQRGDVMMFVTHRPAIKEFGVINVMTGYTYKKKSSAFATIDGNRKFELFTEGDKAWTPDKETDKKMLAAMKAGGKMVVKGTSSRGTLTTDTYSLSGITAAMRAIDRACK